MARKKTAKATFALAFVFFYLQLTLWTRNTQAAAVMRNESPETQATHNIEQSTTLQHDNVTASKSTKLMPQLVAALNETTDELPKKTTLKLLNGPMTTTGGIEASEIIAEEKTVNTTERNEAVMFNARVSEKQYVANSAATATTAVPKTIDTDSVPTKPLSSNLNLNPSQILTTSQTYDSTSTTTASLIEATTADGSKPNISEASKDLLTKRMDVLLDDSVDIQSVSSSGSAKQAKFLNDNSTNSNQLNLPNTADVWTLAGMKNTPVPRHEMAETTSNHSSIADPIKEKVLTDWTQIVKMGVNNALTDDENENATPHEASETTEMLPEHSTRPTTNISALYTTTSPVFLLSTSSHAELFHKLDETTVMPEVNIEKEFHTRLLNNTPLTLTSATIMASADSSLSPNDNADMKATTTSTIEELNKEKSAQDALRNKEQEALELSANQTSVSAASTTIANTLMTTIAPAVEMMSSGSSTPATVIVSGTTTERNSEARLENKPASGITEGEKAVTAEIAKIEATTATAHVVETAKTTTAETTTIDETPKVILATNVTKTINFASTTAQPTPDIHQNSSKSNLETPTTTVAPTAAAAAAEKTTTIEIETTPTSVQSDLNSSAIANVATTTTKRVESSNEASVAAVSVTVDSLSAQSTASVEFSLAETTTTTTSKPAVTTTQAITNHKEGEPVTRVTNDLEETTFSKDFLELSKTSTTSTTAKPQVPVTEQQNEKSVETTTKPLIDESKITVETSTISELAAEKVATSETKLTATTSTTTTTETPNSALEMNANNTEIIFNSSTESNEHTPSTTIKSTAAEATTISTSSTAKTSTSTSTPSTSTVLSVSTNTDDLYETFPETTTATTTTTPAAVTENSTTTVQPLTTPPNPIESTESVEAANTTIEEMIPIATTTTTSTLTQFVAAPSMPAATTMNPLIQHGNIGGALYPPASPKSTPDNPETDVNVIIAISVSVIGVVALILLVAFLYLMRKRQKQTTYGQRCRPVSLDAYSLDNVSVMGSMRKRPSHRSKRSYGNAAFQDPALRHNVIQTAADLAEFVKRRTSIFQEFDDVPKVTARADEIPQGCEDKNRYANVIPLPETRVILQRRNDDDTTEYINANYVRGPSDAPNYYIACQAPLESTVHDFWRMIWEQQSRVIIQATDLIEEAKERCAEYLPPSVTLDNHTTYGDFQVTLKNREVKDKYAISTILLKNTALDNSAASREITHYWYKWPEIGVPTEEAPIIAMLLEARSSLKSYAVEAANELKEKSNSGANGGSTDAADSKVPSNSAGTSSREINGNISEKAKNIARHQGPLTVHCSPGTGRTGTIIACDMAIRSLETTKSLDVPQIVYDIRRGRASAVQTKDQYEFIYKVANIYAMKITNVSNDN